MGITLEVIEPFLKNYRVTKDGRIWSTVKQDWKIPAKDKDGYLRVTLWNKGAAKSIHVHRLVALIYLPNKDRKPQINHKNLNKEDNRLNNLEWVTSKENITHSIINGTRTPRAAPIYLISPFGQLFYCDNRREFIEMHSLYKSAIGNLLSGINRSVYGWKLAEKNNESGLGY